MDNTLMQSIYRDLTELFKKESFQKLSKEEKDKQRDKLIKIATRGVFENIEELDAAQVAFKESQDGMRDPGYAENLRDGFRALMQGATLGFSDEIEAAVQSVWSKVPYNVLLDIKRAEQQNFAKQNPNAALGLELAGGVASALIPAGGIARGGQAFQYGSKVLSNLLNPGSIAARGVQGLGVGKTGKLAAMAKSPITSGAVQGGVDAAAYNLGTAENIITPDNPLSLQGQTQGLDVERLGTDTALGVGLGGVGGKVGQAVAGYVAPKLRSVQDAFSGGSGGRIPPSVSAPMRGLPDDDRRALDLILRRLEEGSISPDELRQVQSQLQAMGKGELATLFDRVNINPQTMQGRTGNPLLAEAKQSLTGGNSTLYDWNIGNRQLAPNVQDRFQQDIVGTVGQPYTREGVAEVQAEAYRRAKPFYAEAEKLNRQTPRYVDGPNIRRFTELPYAQEAYKEGLEGMRVLEQAKPHAFFRDYIPENLQAPVSVKDLDNAQKAFTARKVEKSVPIEKGALSSIRDAALREAGDLVEEYRIARELYAKGSLVDPFESGFSDLLNKDMTLQKVANKYNKLQGEKKLAYRSGMVEALLDKYARTTTKSPDLGKDFRNDNVVAKLRAVSSNEAVDGLLQRAGVEQAFQEATFLGQKANSFTPQGQQAERSFAPNSFDIAARVATDPSGGGITAVNEGANVARRLQDALDFEQAQRTKAAMGRQLMSRGPQADLLTDQLEALQRSQAADDAARRYGLRMLPRTAPMLQNQFLSPLLYGE